jgi:hypothetical protein
MKFTGKLTFLIKTTKFLALKYKEDNYDADIDPGI